MSLGTRIKELRTLRGWSQVDLAQRSGLRRGHISRLESDDYRRPSADTFMRLATALEVEPTELFEAAGYTPPALLPSRDARSLDVILREAQQRYERLETIEVPILGSVPAGCPSSREEQVEGYILVPKEELGTTKKSLFALRVDGDSLEGDGIHSGDLIVVERDPDIINGRIYVFCLRDEYVARHLHQEEQGGRIKLIASDGKHEMLEPDEVIIKGRVILAGRWKKY